MIYHIAIFLLPVLIFYLMCNFSSNSALSFYLFVKAFFFFTNHLIRAWDMSTPSACVFFYWLEL